MSFSNPDPYNRGAGGEWGGGPSFPGGMPGAPQGYGGSLQGPYGGGYGSNYPHHQQGGGGGNYSGSPAPYGAGPAAHQQPAYGAGPPQSQGSAGEFPGGANGQQQVYDENGNLIPEGERGLGTMAMGGMAGFAANKLSGGSHSNMASIGTGALLAQGGKMAYEWFAKHNHGQKKGHGGFPGGGYGGTPGGFGGPPGGGQGAHGGGGGGFFGKRDI